jgi:uncharacterized membrane protein
VTSRTAPSLHASRSSGAVATVLALIFSVSLLVLSMVSTLFGPRLLYRFLQDWVTQVTIGLFTFRDARAVRGVRALFSSILR